MNDARWQSELPEASTPLRARVNYWSKLGLDDDGFTTWTDLVALNRWLGPSELMAFVLEVPALKVLGPGGRVGFMLSRDTRGPADVVTLGSEPGADLILASCPRLLTFQWSHGGWRVGESRLADRQEIPLAPGVDLQFLRPRTLIDELLAS